MAGAACCSGPEDWVGGSTEFGVLTGGAAGRDAGAGRAILGSVRGGARLFGMGGSVAGTGASVCGGGVGAMADWGALSGAGGSPGGLGGVVGDGGGGVTAGGAEDGASSGGGVAAASVACTGEAGSILGINSAKEGMVGDAGVIDDEARSGFGGGSGCDCACCGASNTTATGSASGLGTGAGRYSVTSVVASTAAWIATEQPKAKRGQGAVSA